MTWKRHDYLYTEAELLHLQSDFDEVAYLEACDAERAKENAADLDDRDRRIASAVEVREGRGL